MNTDKEQSASTNSESLDDIRTRKQKEYDAKKSVSFPDEFKSDAEKLLECHEAIRQYQAIVMEQEIKLVGLQVEAALRAGEFRELQKENQDLCDRLNLCGG